MRTDPWCGVAVHPTPALLTEELAAAAAQFYRERSVRLRRSIHIADLFARDARLGLAASHLLGADSVLTAVDVQPVPSEHSRHLVSYVKADVFCWQPNQTFDLVVANPPYVRLNKAVAEHLGLDWGDVRSAGRNVYGLAILRALELCRPGGAAALLCPFSWLESVDNAPLRDTVAALADSIEVIGFRSRGRFPGLTQDVGICLFGKRQLKTTETKWHFSYDDEDSRVIPLPRRSNPEDLSHNYRVRIGPVVWNRRKAELTGSSAHTLEVIYGADIRDGELLRSGRYAARRFIRKSGVRAGEMTCGPAVVIRRIMRGAPGEWIVDTAVIPRHSCVVAENHVILVENVSTEAEAATIAEYISQSLPGIMRPSGSPSLSKCAVTQILADANPSDHSSKVSRAS